MTDLVIVGTMGLAREAAFVAEEINKESKDWNIIGFISGDRADVGKTVGKYKVLGDDDFLVETDKKLAVVFGIGRPKIIQQIWKRIHENPNLSFPNLIHPNAVYDSERVVFGEGNVVCAGSVLTTDISVGSFNYLNLSCTYGHDVRIGSFCVVNPSSSISGFCVLGDGCLIGTGARVLEGLEVGDGATVGAGSVVLKNVPPETTVIGVPAKVFPRAA